MSNRRYNSQTRAKKMGGGMMRKNYKEGSANPKMADAKKIKKTFAPKKKKSFPDLNKDGKVTFADVLKGRGVKRA